MTLGNGVTVGKCWLGWRPLGDRLAEGWRGPERTVQRFGKEVHLLLFCSELA